jgi:hypothetical protein
MGYNLADSMSVTGKSSGYYTLLEIYLTNVNAELVHL